jgi:hypothetical protein
MRTLPKADKMSEDNEKAWLRPSTHALISKLRTMKVMQDQSVKVEVTRDLIYQLRTDPVALHRIISYALGWWDWNVNELSPEYKKSVISRLNEDELGKVEIDDQVEGN